MQRRTSRRGVRARGDRGAALVEFAFISIPLVLLLFGTIEFGWAFFQLNDVRHGAREGLRLVEVNASPMPDHGAPVTAGERLAQETCERMDQRDGASVRIQLADADGDGVLGVGDEATLKIEKDLEQITDVLDFALGGVTFDESITGRLELDPGAGIDGTTWTCAS